MFWPVTGWSRSPRPLSNGWWARDTEASLLGCWWCQNTSPMQRGWRNDAAFGLVLNLAFLFEFWSTPSYHKHCYWSLCSFVAEFVRFLSCLRKITIKIIIIEFDSIYWELEIQKLVGGKLDQKRYCFRSNIRCIIIKINGDRCYTRKCIELNSTRKCYVQYSQCLFCFFNLTISWKLINVIHIYRSKLFWTFVEYIHCLFCFLINSWKVIYWAVDSVFLLLLLLLLIGCCCFSLLFFSSSFLGGEGGCCCLGWGRRGEVYVYGGGTSFAQWSCLVLWTRSHVNFLAAYMSFLDITFSSATIFFMQTKTSQNFIKTHTAQN